MWFVYGFFLGASSAWLTLLIQYYFTKRALNNRVAEARKLIAEEDVRIKLENDRIIEKIERSSLTIKDNRNDPTLN